MLCLETAVPISSPSVSSKGSLTSTIPSPRTASAVHGVYSCIEKGWTGHRSMSNSSPHFIPFCLAYALLSDPTKFQRTTRAHKNNLQLRKRDVLSMHTLFENGNFPVFPISLSRMRAAVQPYKASAHYMTPYTHSTTPLTGCAADAHTLQKQKYPGFLSRRKTGCQASSLLLVKQAPSTRFTTTSKRDGLTVALCRNGRLNYIPVRLVRAQLTKRHRFCSFNKRQPQCTRLYRKGKD